MNSTRIIQAGMGVGVSNWILANAVAKSGQIGVVSGTALDIVLVRRLQNGDHGGNIRRAMANFPDQEFASRVLGNYFIANGRPNDRSYVNLPILTAKLSEERESLIVLANFVEVFLAKEGHSGKIGINYLEKISLPILPSLYGAMLAGVDLILMGAGIPREVPSVLDKLVRNEDVEYKLYVTGASVDDNYKLTFSPAKAIKNLRPRLERPKFFGIISSTVLALTLTKKVQPPADGFVIESPTAGGHNAPPRGKLQLNGRGEPLYGERDEVDLNMIADLGVPFWLAGSRGSAEGLREAIRSGASGIQVGTAFALCEESGLDPKIKDEVIKLAVENRLEVFTDPKASPTAFPFKVARLPETNSEPENYEKRMRRCDLGYLRELYKNSSGAIGYRCPAEPVDQYVKKGGLLEQTVGRKCLCNGLTANVGLAQTVLGAKEMPLVTIGDDVKNIRQFMRGESRSFSAADVISVLLGKSPRDRLELLQ